LPTGGSAHIAAHFSFFTNSRSVAFDTASPGLNSARGNRRSDGNCLSMSLPIQDFETIVVVLGALTFDQRDRGQSSKTR
jgi:hypothetical protein